jgi:hypothetical protein
MWDTMLGNSKSQRRERRPQHPMLTAYWIFSNLLEAACRWHLVTCKVQLGVNPLINSIIRQFLSILPNRRRQRHPISCAPTKPITTAVGLGPRPLTLFMFHSTTPSSIRGLLLTALLTLVRQGTHAQAVVPVGAARYASFPLAAAKGAIQHCVRPADLRSS